MQQHVVPEEAGGGVGERVIPPGVAAGEPAERLLQVVGDVSFRHPGVTVRRVDAVAVEVVQQDELLRQRVVVGRDVAAEDAQIRVPVALSHVPEELIVSPVLLDHVDDVVEEGRLSQPFRYRDRLLPRGALLPRAQDLRHASVGPHLPRILLQPGAARHWDPVHGAGEVVVSPASPAGRTGA